LRRFSGPAARPGLRHVKAPFGRRRGPWGPETAVLIANRENRTIRVHRRTFDPVLGARRGAQTRPVSARSCAGVPEVRIPLARGPKMANSRAESCCPRHHDGRAAASGESKRSCAVKAWCRQSPSPRKQKEFAVIMLSPPPPPCPPPPSSTPPPNPPVRPAPMLPKPRSLCMRVIPPC